MTVAGDLDDDGCAENDIEDIGELHGDEHLFSSDAFVSQSHRVKKPHKVIKRTAKIARKTKKLNADDLLTNGNTDDACSPLREQLLFDGLPFTTAAYNSKVPGTETVFIKTWGCSHNNSDSEYMAGLLATYGYRVILDENLRDIADLWLLNSCTVKSPAESQFRNAVEHAQKSNKHVVVAGCVPQGASRTSYINGISVIGVQQIDRVVEVVEETLKGHSVRLLGQRRVGSRKAGGAPLLLPKVRKNPLIEIIAISTGCLNSCTYCKTKHARGNLGSYPPEEIIARAEQAFAEGVRELWITSEDTGAYGRDIGTTLPEMLQSLIAVIPDGCKLRIGMTNPPYILDHLTEMSEILKHPRVYAFIHIPVQAGSDKVLYDMKREYTRADFERVCDTLLRLVPNVYIATDVICGFPTETDEDFQETVDLVNKYRFPSLFINQFYPRPGTAAANIQPQVPSNVKKARSKTISEIFNSYSRYAADRVGQVLTVLVTELASDGQHYVGHTDSYEQVLIAPQPRYMGSTLRVRVTDYSKHSMKADVIEELCLYNKLAYKPQLMPMALSDAVKVPDRLVMASTSDKKTLSWLLSKPFVLSVREWKNGGGVNLRLILGVVSFFVLAMAVLSVVGFSSV